MLDLWDQALKLAWDNQERARVAGENAAVALQAARQLVTQLEAEVAHCSAAYRMAVSERDDLIARWHRAGAKEARDEKS